MEKGSAGSWSLARNDHPPWFLQQLSTEYPAGRAILSPHHSHCQPEEEHAPEGAAKCSDLAESFFLHSFPCLLLSQRGPAHMSRTKSHLKCQICTSRGTVKTSHASGETPTKFSGKSGHRLIKDPLYWEGTLPWDRVILNNWPKLSEWSHWETKHFTNTT